MKTVLIATASLLVGIYLGIQIDQFIYLDICLDMGGGTNPGEYPICVVEK